MASQSQSLYQVQLTNHELKYIAFKTAARTHTCNWRYCAINQHQYGPVTQGLYLFRRQLKNFSSSFNVFKLKLCRLTLIISKWLASMQLHTTLSLHTDFIPNVYCHRYKSKSIDCHLFIWTEVHLSFFNCMFWSAPCLVRHQGTTNTYDNTIVSFQWLCRWSTRSFWK